MLMGHIRKIEFISVIKRQTGSTTSITSRQTNGQKSTTNDQARTKIDQVSTTSDQTNTTSRRVLRVIRQIIQQRNEYHRYRKFLLVT